MKKYSDLITDCRTYLIIILKFYLSLTNVLIDLEIGEPFFPGSVSGLSSFAAYSIPAEIHQSFELSMHFVPNFIDQIALMMYIGHDASTDHVALSFIKGYIVLTWNLGAGARRIFTPKPINFQPKKAHVVKLGRDGRTAWLMVDNFPNVTGQSVGRLSQLNTKPVLYLGNRITHYLLIMYISVVYYTILNTNAV